MPKFKIGDLVLDKAVPEAGFPIPDDRPMIIIEVRGISAQVETVSYSVILPGGHSSLRFESEIVPLTDN